MLVLERYIPPPHFPGHVASAMPPLRWMPDVINPVGHRASAFITCARGHALSVAPFQLFEWGDADRGEADDNEEERTTVVKGLQCWCGWGAGRTALMDFDETIRAMNQASAREGLGWDPDEAHVVIDDEPDLSGWTKLRCFLKYSWRIGLDALLHEFRCIVGLQLVAIWGAQFSAEHARILATNVSRSPAWKFYPVVLAFMLWVLVWHCWRGLRWCGLTLIGRTDPELPRPGPPRPPPPSLPPGPPAAQ